MPFDLHLGAPSVLTILALLWPPTLDNPGWSLSVDLGGATLEGRAFSPVYDGVSAEEQPVQGGDGDVPWLVCRLEGARFKAWGGPRDLGRMIQAFRSWAEA